VLRRRELEVFGIRLAITLPFLVLAAWAVARRRQSVYWPLWRGMVLFGVLVFFAELVPYLPSYGGYVREVVGVVLTAVAGVWGIRQMQRYFARRAELAAAHAAAGSRAALQPDVALPKLRAGVCPACDRPLAGASDGPVNYCGGCGLHVYAPCRQCAARVSTALTFCPQCGASDPTGPVGGAAGGAPAPSAPAPSAPAPSAPGPGAPADGGRVLVGAGASAGGAAAGRVP
jgi:predicted RNA-binding Zn-ribbon protein involved in translation (DUF1610 family)